VRAERKKNGPRIREVPQPAACCRALEQVFTLPHVSISSHSSHGSLNLIIYIFKKTLSLSVILKLFVPMFLFVYFTVIRYPHEILAGTFDAVLLAVIEAQSSSIGIDSTGSLASISRSLGTDFFQ
jgi:hypothetical protein